MLDTNVMSVLMRPVQHRPASDDVVIRWLDNQDPHAIWTTAVSVFELQNGIKLLSPGRRRHDLDRVFAFVMEEKVDGRVLGFDAPAAVEAAQIGEALRRIGRPIDIRDLMIAGTVAAHGATFVTRNTKHFADTGVSVVDPWNEPAA